MRKSIFITYDELIIAEEADLTDNHYKEAAEILINAITDWPSYELAEPDEIVKSLKEAIQKPLTYDNLDSYQKALSLEGDNGWKKESISYLLELFDFDRKKHFDKSIELETLIENLTKHYRAQI